MQYRSLPISRKPLAGGPATHIPSANRIPPMVPRIIATNVLFFIMQALPFFLLRLWQLLPSSGSPPLLLSASACASPVRRRSFFPDKSEILLAWPVIYFCVTQKMPQHFKLRHYVGEVTRTPDLPLRRRLHYPLCYTNLFSYPHKRQKGYENLLCNYNP